ncbi:MULTISPECIES: hypothetical protein [Actinosynnema]|uniref:hypothetical protein n=1 Tax=Actinosynnema TaxID=40566 RepID=UPI0020A235E7|nr:hypothetical protein [Actinosynnema pretiosum]
MKIHFNAKGRDCPVDPDLREHAIEAMNYDYVYFAEFEGMVLAETALRGHDEVLRTAFEAAKELILEGTIVPGDLGWRTDGFGPWPLTPEESVARIEREVAEHLRTGERIHMGDICWFDLPARITEREAAKRAAAPDSPAPDSPVKDG